MTNKTKVPIAKAKDEVLKQALYLVFTTSSVTTIAAPETP